MQDPILKFLNGVAPNTNKKKKLSYKQANKKYGLTPFGDIDGDAVLNIFDCRPYDPTKHSMLSDWEERRRFKQIQPQILKMAKKSEKENREYGAEIRYKKNLFGSKYSLGELKKGKEDSVMIGRHEGSVGTVHHHPSIRKFRAKKYKKTMRAVDEYQVRPSRADIRAGKEESRYWKQPHQEMVTTKMKRGYGYSRTEVSANKGNRYVKVKDVRMFGKSPGRKPKHRPVIEKIRKWKKRHWGR